MTSFNIYRVRFVQSQRYAINISAPSAELAEFFAEEIRKRAGAAPFEAIGDPFSGDWQSEEICSANTPDLLAAVANDGEAGFALVERARDELHGLEVAAACARLQAGLPELVRDVGRRLAVLPAAGLPALHAVVGKIGHVRPPPFDVGLLRAKGCRREEKARDRENPDAAGCTVHG